MSAAALLPTADRRDPTVAGVRFALWRAQPPRPRRTTPALLLHGVPQTAAMWRDLLPELQRDRVVLAPDLKGLGESDGGGSYAPRRLAAELAGLVGQQVQGPVDIVGHDWGGVLGLSLAAHRPELVRRLVVIDAPYRYLDPLHALHVPLFALPVLPELAFRLGGEALVRWMLRVGWRSERPLPAPIATHYAAAYAEPARVAAMLAYYRATARPWVRRRLSPGHRAADRPALVRAERHLVVWGARDPVLPLRVGESVVRDLGADTTFVTVPGAGHFVVEEAPDVVVPVIAAFVRETGAPRSRPPG